MNKRKRASQAAAACLAVIVAGCGLLVADGCASQRFRLNVLAYGRGRVLLDPGGGTYENGTSVSLLAISEGDVFTLWGRDASGSDLITRVVVDRDKLVVALFEGNQPPSRLYEDPVIEAVDGQFLGVINNRELDTPSIANRLGD